MVIIVDIMNSKKGKRQKERQSTMRMLTLITQFGINMLVPIFLCFFAGYYLDQKLGTSYLIVVFFFIGALAGFRNVYIFARRMMKDDREDAKDINDIKNIRDNKKDIEDIKEKTNGK